MLLRRVTRGLWQVLAICRSRGDCPLLEALADLEANLADDRARMLRLVEHVAHHGPPRNEEKSKPLREGIFEFRAGQLRILWFYGDERRMIICTHLLVKKTQKTPRGEIERAIRVRQAYLLAVQNRAIDIE